jgi:hypothetical protein
LKLFDRKIKIFIVFDPSKIMDGKVIFSETITNFRARKFDGCEEEDHKEITVFAATDPQTYGSYVKIGGSVAGATFGTSHDAIRHAKHVKAEILRGVPCFDAIHSTLPRRPTWRIVISFVKDRMVNNPMFWAGLCFGAAAGLASFPYLEVIGQPPQPPKIN